MRGLNMTSLYCQYINRGDILFLTASKILPTLVSYVVKNVFYYTRIHTQKLNCNDLRYVDIGLPGLENGFEKT